MLGLINGTRPREFMRDRISRQNREQNMRIAALAAAALVTLAMAMPAAAVTVEANVSTEFQKKLDQDLGSREAKTLTDALTRKIDNAFNSTGVNAARVVVTIEDAKPNRPTFKQASDKLGLDPMRSISIGGAKISGVAYDASGQEIGRYEHKWYESDLSNVIGAGTWSDARTSFDRFARRFADKLS
jgi:hypothetical protein